MPSTILYTTYVFNRTEYDVNVGADVDVYTSYGNVFDHASRLTSTVAYDEVRLSPGSPPPPDYYLAPGEFYSYCAGTTRHPWVSTGLGEAVAGDLEPDSTSCGAPPPVYGCTNPLALNYNGQATADDGSCVLPSSAVLGCTNPRARNYNPAATQDDNSCAFGPVGPLAFTYNGPQCLTVVFNEALDLFVTEQTYRPQMLLPIEGKGFFTLPLPGQSGDSPSQRYLWEHNAGPEVNALGALRLYGRAHPVWFEVVVLGSGEHMVKNVDNFIFVANEELPTSVAVTAPEQGSFTQTFVTSGHRLSLTCRRQEQLTYAVLEPPKGGLWGGRVRAKWVRLRFTFAAKKQLRLSNLLVLLRESVS